MREEPFTNRELQTFFDHLHEKLDRMESKLDYTNGKVRRLYLVLTIIGSVTATLLIVNGSLIVEFILKLVI